MTIQFKTGMFILLLIISTSCTSNNAQEIFNGENLEGWHLFNKSSASINSWKAKDGVLFLDGDLNGEGDLITDKQYENFELELEWKISRGGNSGIMINVQEGDSYSNTFVTGPEMQILDNKEAADNQDKTHLSGSLYDMIGADPDFAKPAGEWNQVKIRQDQGKLTFWLNDNKIMDVQLASKEWEELIANSKFNDMPEFGKFTKGHIALQDHGDSVWFRKIRIREL